VIAVCSRVILVCLWVSGVASQQAGTMPPGCKLCCCGLLPSLVRRCRRRAGSSCARRLKLQPHFSDNPPIISHFYWLLQARWIKLCKETKLIGRGLTPTDCDLMFAKVGLGKGKFVMVCRGEIGWLNICHAGSHAGAVIVEHGCFALLGFRVRLLARMCSCPSPNLLPSQICMQIGNAHPCCRSRSGRRARSPLSR